MSNWGRRSTPQIAQVIHPEALAVLMLHDSEASLRISHSEDELSRLSIAGGKPVSWKLWLAVLGAIPADFPSCLRHVIEDWQFDTDARDQSNGWGLWLHSDSGGVDAVCAFIQHLLEEFDPEGHATLEWSNDCSKPRLDAFGGGAAVITAGKIKTINTGQWLHRQVARLQKHQPAPTLVRAQ